MVVAGEEVAMRKIDHDGCGQAERTGNSRWNFPGQQRQMEANQPESQVVIEPLRRYIRKQAGYSSVSKTEKSITMNSNGLAGHPPMQK